MKRLSFDLLLGATLLLGILSSAYAAQRAFVASYGNDAGNLTCLLATPCRGFQAAINAVDPSGEVVVLDSAGYGPMTIGKSVAVIVPTGLHAGITVSAGNGVSIQAVGIVVALRGLYVNALGGSRGIDITDAAEVHVENCVVAGFANQGINLRASGARMWVLDTIVRDNVRGGIVVDNSGLAARATVVIDRARVENNGFQQGLATDAGVAAVSGADVTVTNSVMSGNFRGVSACGTFGTQANAVVVVDKSVVTFNVVGLYVVNNGSTACVLVASDTDITRNSLFGIEQQVSVATSYGGNTVFNNAANTFGLTVGKI